jgi:membrane protease YdiL (CAAX protease family)
MRSRYPNTSTKWILTWSDAIPRLSVGTARAHKSCRISPAMAEHMQNESPHWAAFRRFIARFKIAKIFAFSIPLFAALVASQLLIRGVGHALPQTARPLWSVATKVLYVFAMLWLYSLEVRYFECRRSSELAPRDAALRVSGGVLVGFVLFSSVLAFLYLGGYVHQVQFNGFTGMAAQASASLGAAVGEELLFRGAIFRISEEWLGTTAALMISAVLFGAAHGLNAGATPIGVLAIALEAGVLLGVAYCASRSLWLPIGMHFGWNFTEGGLFGTAVSGGQSHGLVSVTLDGPSQLTGGVFGPEASIVAVAVCLTAATILGIYSVRRGRWRPWLQRAEA